MGDALLGTRWKKFALASIFVMLVSYEHVSSLTSLPDIVEIVRTIYSAVLDRGDQLMIGCILSLQIVMLVRQPQHVIDSTTKDREGHVLGITHSLSFYNSNLTKAQTNTMLENLKSSDAIWDYGTRGRNQ